MKFVLAPDSFKESMTSMEACLAMERGIKKVFEDAECIKVPMADGGEGTVDALVNATDGEFVEVEVTDPLGRRINARYGILGDGNTAVIEMAKASGIELIKREERNPYITTTYGTGELIKDAVNRGIKHILIGIGGSATNDAGAGMLQALGVKLLDSEKQEIPFGGASLEKVEYIEKGNIDELLKDVTIEVACDVTNPLVGENGASHIFGPQKGATPEMVEVLDNNLRHFASKVNEVLGIDIANAAGSGAAGGLGGALLAFLDAELKSGIDLVIKYTNLEDKVKDCDYVFTGEGAIDGQTIFGKTPMGVLKVGNKHNIPVMAFAGKVDPESSNLYDEGMNSIHCIMRGVENLDDALKNGSSNLERTTESVVRILI